MEQNIRPVDETGLEQALALVWRVFLLFEAPEYPPESVREFERFIERGNILGMMRSGRMRLWGWYESGVIAITVTGHINLLFVEAAYHHRGIARTLHQTAMAYLTDHGVTEVTVDSSPYTVEAYRRRGFTATDTQRLTNGIRYTPMELYIDAK